MTKAQEYTYRVFWSKNDRAFIGAVAEFPSLSHVADNQNDALAGIVDLVAFVLEDMTNNKEHPPLPLGERKFSGKFALRMPPELHRRIAIEAAEQGVSINQLLVTRI